MDWALDQNGPTPVSASVSSVVCRTEKKLPLHKCAVRLNELSIHNSRTWFDEGDICLDARVVHGNVSRAKAVNFYHPNTFSFPRVADRSIESCGSHNRKQGLSGHSSHRRVSASFIQLAENLEAGEHPDGYLKVKDLSFTQEIRAQ
jgi:hypothetical protein